MRVRVWFLYFSLFFCLSAQAKALLPHALEGRPGCYELVRNQSLSPTQVAALPKDCQNLRSDYLKALKLLSENPERFAKALNQIIATHKKAQAPYEAILFALLLRQKNSIQALEKRAKIEKELRVPFQYAKVALERLKGKECIDLDSTLQHPFYQELCTSKDSILSEFYEVYQKPKRRGHS